MADDQKEVEFYAAKVNAWFATRFELDRSLLTLSAGGIGILITFALATGIKNSATLVIYCSALFAFVICLFLVLWIFQRNAVHLERSVKDGDVNDSVLEVIDKAARAAFLLGVLLASLLGVSAAFDSLLEKKELEMNDPKKQKSGVPLNESVNGIQRMQPQWVEGSVNGINNMKPAPQQTQQPVSPNSPAATPEKSK